MEAELRSLQLRLLKNLCRKAGALKKNPTAEEKDLIYTLLARLGRDGEYEELRQEVRSLWQRVNELEGILAARKQ